MSLFLSPKRHPYYSITATLLVLLSFQGCATPPSASRAGAAAALDGSPRRITAHLSQQPTRANSTQLIPVVRYGRYTLIELAPGAGQQDLLKQIVDITIPPTLAATVGEALRYVLLRSGLMLCDSPEVRILNTLPLPAADFHLGPLTLESALRILAGPGWKLEVDELTRRVCFLPASQLPPDRRSSLGGPNGNDGAANRARSMSGKHRS